MVPRSRSLFGTEKARDGFFSVVYFADIESENGARSNVFSFVVYHLGNASANFVSRFRVEKSNCRVFAQCEWLNLIDRCSANLMRRLCNLKFKFSRTLSLTGRKKWAFDKNT